MKSKQISIEEFGDGSIFTVTAGWHETIPHSADDELGMASSYMRCENGNCQGHPYHFPPKWESYGEHERKYPMPPIQLTDEMLKKLGLLDET